MTPQEIFDELKSTINKFQEANAKAQDEFRAGLKSAATNEQVEALNARITELKKLAEEANRNAQLAQIGGSPSGDPVKERISAARFLSMAKRTRIRPNDASLNIEAYRAYKEAFFQAALVEFNMDAVSPEIRAAMSVGSAPDGGFFVPDEMSTELEKRIHDTSEMRQLARVITIGAPAWEAPWKTSKGTSGGWVGEKQARPATGTPAVGMQRIETHEQYAYPEVTQSMLDDSAMNVEAFLMEDTEEEMVRTENTGFVSGDGIMKPKGFLGYTSGAVTTVDASRDWGKLQYIPVGAAGAFPQISGSVADDANCFISAIAALHPTYRQGAVWAMNRLTEAAVRKLRDSQGRYLVGFGDIRDSSVGFNLFGFPIANLEDMPAIASDSYSIAFANFKRGYFIIDRMGFRVLRDPYTNKPFVGFYITKRTGGDVRNFDAIKLLKFAAS